MEAKELRYGNILQTDRAAKGEVIYVNTLSRDPDTNEVLLATNHYPFLTLSQCKPIPLTGEWLIKLGFNKHGRNGGYEVSVHSRDENGVVNFGLDDGHHGLEPQLKYVHQLQNLYFALTGEELTMKK